MRNMIFAAVLATSALLATGHAHAASATPSATPRATPGAVSQAEPANPLVEQVYWVRYYYRTYVRTCGWVPTVYGPMRVCN